MIRSRDARGEPISVDEFRDYVTRAEARLASATEPAVLVLQAHYAHLAKRFEADLGDERDVLVSRAAALMLVETLLRSGEQRA